VGGAFAPTLSFAAIVSFHLVSAARPRWCVPMGANVVCVGATSMCVQLCMLECDEGRSDARLGARPIGLLFGHSEVGRVC
jgi:hypothetical protein